MARRPNVILIMADQWRGDALSIAGHPVVHTPHLDALALDGVRFDRAYSAVPSCIAARTALHTGQSQETHGRVGYRDGVPWDCPATLAGEFARHGYQTQAVGKMHVFPERLLLGFHHVVLHDGFVHFARRRRPGCYDAVDDYLPWLRAQLGRDADYFDHGVDCNSVLARPWDKPEHVHPTNFAATQAIDFLRRRDPTKPFFLFLSFHRPHPPYDPPAWAFEQYLDRAMPDPPTGDWTTLFAPVRDDQRHTAQAARMDHRVVHRTRAGYYGHLTHIDTQINRVLEMAAEHGELDNSVVCFTADHGEMLGDHNLFRKALPYEGSARIPLIVRGPKGCAWSGGQCVHEVTELRDVMPTLLDAAGLPVPSSVEGHSLLPLARGESPAWRPHLHGEHVVRGQAFHWMTDGREKYIWVSGEGLEQLFDLREDPQERYDIEWRPERADRLTHWRQALIEALSGREEGFTDGERLIAGRPVNPVLRHLRERAGLNE